MRNHATFKFRTLGIYASLSTVKVCTILCPENKGVYFSQYQEHQPTIQTILRPPPRVERGGSAERGGGQMGTA